MKSLEDTSRILAIVDILGVKTDAARGILRWLDGESDGIMSHATKQVLYDVAEDAYPIDPIMSSFEKLQGAATWLEDEISKRLGSALDESTSLKDLEKYLIIKQLVGNISTAEAGILHSWFKQIQSRYEDLPADLADKLANSEFAKTDIAGKDISNLPDHRAAPIVRGKLQSMLYDTLDTHRTLDEGLSKLETLSLSLEIATSLGISRKDAAILLDWILGDSSTGVFFDMSNDAIQAVYSSIDGDDNQPMQLPTIKNILRDRYKIPFL